MSELCKHGGVKYKSGDYHCTTIDDFASLTKWMDDAIQRSKNATIIFRGQKDYSYKNYSSAQRKWILEDYVSKYGDGEAPYTNFICKAIEECRCWENKLLPKFYSKIGSEFSDLSALSIMQHYGLPTPLIDFTRNVVVALSFAVGTENHQSAEEDGYFSIYEVDVEKNIERIVKLSDNKELARKSYRDIAKLRRLFFIDTIILSGFDTGA